jgi:hypothetical protein
VSCGAVFDGRHARPVPSSHRASVRVMRCVADAAPHVVLCYADVVIAAVHR